MANTNGSPGSLNGKERHAALAVSPVPAGEPASAHCPAAAIEYYILCPQRETEVPGLITHLISRDICDQRQSENYHKCANCIRSQVWRAANGLGSPSE